MACRVRRACEAWSASVRDIYRGNAKQRELRGVAYNGSDGSRVWAYYKTVYTVVDHVTLVITQRSVE